MQMQSLHVIDRGVDLRSVADSMCTCMVSAPAHRTLVVLEGQPLLFSQSFPFCVLKMFKGLQHVLAAYLHPLPVFLST